MTYFRRDELQHLVRVLGVCCRLCPVPVSKLVFEDVEDHESGMFRASGKYNSWPFTSDDLVVLSLSDNAALSK
jgi:hypothetical protein